MRLPDEREGTWEGLHCDLTGRPAHIASTAMSYPQSVHDRVRTFLAARYGKRGTVGLALLAGAYLSNHYFDEWLTGKVLPYLWRQLQALAELPVGIVGLLLATLVAALIVVGFVDTSPTAAVLREWLASKKQKPLALSREESESIQPIRALWNLHGAQAAEVLLTLFAEVEEALRQEHYWAELLREVQVDFRTHCQRIAEATAMDSKIPLVEVRARFDAFFSAYLKVVKWLGNCIDSGDVAFTFQMRRAYNGWHNREQAFSVERDRLNQIPEHHGKLRMFAQSHMMDPATLRFWNGNPKGLEPPKADSLKTGVTIVEREPGSPRSSDRSRDKK